MIGQSFSHYRIIDRLGEGGMGVVYVAEDTHLGRRVAIKFPSAGLDEHHYRARFLREARSASALNHPHIATIYDYGELDDGQPFIVMELVDGQPLNRLIGGSALTLVRAVEIVGQVAEALAEAHARGLIHRDIKPSNVIVGARCGVKVLDFGLAKHLNEGRDGMANSGAATLAASPTLSNAVVGTPLYLSPEQAKGVPVDARSDLFALGALLYECVAGRPAFSGANPLEIGARVIFDNPPPPSYFNPRVPPELDRITLKALSKSPEGRYQTAEEFRADLQALRAALLSDDQTTRTIPVSAARSTPRVRALTTHSRALRLPRPGGAALAVLLTAALGLLAWIWWPPAPHRPPADAARWYEDGERALRDGAYYQASKALARAVEIDGRFLLARARLAEAWAEMDYTDRAKDEIIRATDRSRLPRAEALRLEAVRATVTRDFAGAVGHYRRLAELAPALPEVFLDLGRAYEKTDEITKAIESYTRATERDPQYATAYLRLGILHGRRRELERALPAFEAAEALYQARGNVEGRAEVAYQRGALFNRVGRFAEAREQLGRSLDLSLVSGNEYQQISALSVLSDVSLNAGDSAMAEHYAREVIARAEAGDMKTLRARGLLDLGTVFFTDGKFAEAERYFKQVLEFAQTFGASGNEARALLMLGSLRQRQGALDEVLQYVGRALAFYQQGGYGQEAAKASTLIGRVNRQRGDYGAALRIFQQQLQLAERMGDPSLVRLSHEAIGQVFLAQERYPDALFHYDACYEVARATGDQIGIRYGLWSRGRALWRLGRYEEARAAFRQAAALADGPGDKDKALTTFIRYYDAQMALSERRFVEAKTRAEQVLAMEGAQNPEVAVGMRSVLCLAQTSTGSHARGRRACEEAVAAAARSGQPLLLSRAQLALAEALLEDGDAPGALTLALRAQENFARSGQRDSEWRAWLIAARASRQVGDRAGTDEYSSRASELLASLRQEWGEDVFNSYLARPDIRHSRKILDELLAAN